MLSIGGGGIYTCTASDLTPAIDTITTISSASLYISKSLVASLGDTLQGGGDTRRKNLFVAEFTKNSGQTRLDR